MYDLYDDSFPMTLEQERVMSNCLFATKCISCHSVVFAMNDPLCDVYFIFMIHNDRVFFVGCVVRSRTGGVGRGEESRMTGERERERERERSLRWMRV